MGAALVGFIVGGFLLYQLGLRVGASRERKNAPADTPARPDPLDEIKQAIPGFVVATIVIVVLIVIGRRRG